MNGTDKKETEMLFTTPELNEITKMEPEELLEAGDRFRRLIHRDGCRLEVPASDRVAPFPQQMSSTSSSRTSVFEMKEEPFFFDVQLNRAPGGTTINDERANEFRRYLERKHAQEAPEEVELVDVEAPEAAAEPEGPEAETLRFSRPVVQEHEEELPMTLFEKVVTYTFTAGAVLYFVALIAFFIWIVLLGPGIWDRY